MKYPWVALSLVILWFATTYIILVQENINVTYILMTLLVGTIIISILGFRPPKIKK